MGARGFDPTDQDQLDTFMLLYNQRLAAGQPPVPPLSAKPESQPTRRGGLRVSKKTIMDLTLGEAESDTPHGKFIASKMKDRWTPDKIRQMSTEEIIAKLSSFGVRFDPQAFLERDVKTFRSALEDRDAVYERLAQMFEERGYHAKAKHYARLATESRQRNQPVVNLPSPKLQAAPRGSLSPPAKKPKIGPNEPCPCGSGKKYKRCCGL